MWAVVQHVFIYGLFWNLVKPSSGNLTCYHCDKAHGYPDCLNDPHMCHHDEACIFENSTHGMSVNCKNAHECAPDHNLGTCGNGGVLTKHGCEVCCRDEDCVSQSVAALMGVPMASTPATLLPTQAGCPNDCHHQPDLITCLMSGHQCHGDEYCHLNFDEHGLRGRCEKAKDIRHCYDESRDHSDSVCQTGDVTQVQNHVHCIFCCSGDNCPAVSFLNPNAASSTVQLVNTTPAQTLNMVTATLVQLPVSSSPGNALLGGNCDDLALDCQENKAVMCTSNAGIRQCAKTCGLCTLIQTTFSGSGQCQDQLINNQCELFQETKNICADKIADYTCPMTCGTCERKLTDLVQQVLSAAATTQPIAVAATVETCVDTLADMPCTALPDVCTNSLAQMVCRKYCGLCGVSAPSQ